MTAYLMLAAMVWGFGRLGTGPVLMPVAVADVVPVVFQADGRISPASSVDELLVALQKRGEGLTDFDADVKLSDTDPNFAIDKVRTGRFWYHVSSAEGGATKLRVTFNTLDGKPQKNEYLLDGQWLTDRDYRKKNEVRRQVLRPGQKMNLIKLGEGPFPLPIGQDPEEVKRQFDVTKIDPVNGLPSLKLVPKSGTRLASKFSEINVSIDPANNFPTRIETIDGGKTLVKTTEITNLRLNPPGGIKDEEFQLPPIDKNDNSWSHTDEPYVD